MTTSTFPIFAAACIAALAPDRPALLLVDTSTLTHVQFAWTTEDGEQVTLDGQRKFLGPSDASHIGENIDCYVALGGSRLEKGAGHPKGAIVRVGLYKRDQNKPLFRDIAPGSAFTIRLDNVRFNQPVLPNPGTGLQHLKYYIDDLKSCGLGYADMNQYNTESPTDLLNGRVNPGVDTRLGSLEGTITTWRAQDGTIAMEATIPYAMLRHMRDPWELTTPGTFFEPQHFHLEFEVLPEPVAIDEGVEPAERPAARPRTRSGELE